MKETTKMCIVIKLLEILQTARSRSLQHAEQHKLNYSAILIRSCAISVAGTPLKHQKGKTSACSPRDSRVYFPSRGKIKTFQTFES